MIASFHGQEEMQVVGEMMMRHTERVYQLTDIGCEEKWAKYGALRYARVARHDVRRMLTEFDELLSVWQIWTEPWECRVANSELRLEPFYQNVVINGIERGRYI